MYTPTTSSAPANGWADLRSDTLTSPTPGMRRAMAEAEVGDDVYAEDPTVNELEAYVAELFGHEAALFVPTGTMGNQICLRLVCPPADELLCDTTAHIVTYEHGGAAAHGGIQTRTLRAERGLLDPAEIAEEIRPDGYHLTPTRAVALENTHNRGGGVVYPLPVIEEFRRLTTERGVLLHCDGARIWNAAVAAGLPLSTYGALFDTLSVCLSKGLGAPVGSVVVASADRIAEARLLRKRLGGGMRQAGVLAAAGLYALRHQYDRLAEDHERARRLAGVVADAAPGVLDPDRVQTNIVPLDLSGARLSGPELGAAAKQEGVLMSVVGPTRARLVTHLDAGDDEVDRAAKVVAGLLAG